MEINLVPETETIKARDYISFSEIRKYEICPLKHYYHYVLGDKEPADLNLVFGSAVHSAIEVLLRSIMDGKSLTHGDASNLFRHFFQTEIKEKDLSIGAEDNIPHLERTGVNLVYLWCLERASTVLPVQVEQKYLVTLPGIEKPVLMYVDLVEANGEMFEGRASTDLVVTDIKTSKTDYALHNPSLSLQLALYCKAVGTRLCRFDVLNKKKGTFQPVLGVMYPSVQEYLFDRFRKTLESINLGICIPPAPGEWPCTPNCYYWSKCAGTKIPDIVFESAREEKLRIAGLKELLKAKSKTRRKTA